LAVHSVIAIGLGIAAIITLYFLQTKSVGFWIVGWLYSLMWGFIVGFLYRRLCGYSVTEENMLWMYVAWAIGALLFLGLHLIARSRQEL